MRLRDLEGKLVRRSFDGTRELEVPVETVTEATGVTFVCPVPECNHSVLVHFSGRGVPDDATPGPGRWEATGTTIDDITCSPSIQIRCWHGWIRNGEAVS